MALTNEQQNNLLSVKQKLKVLFDTIESTAWGRYVMSHSRNLYLTGSSIGDLIRGDTPKDWDIYFRNERVARDIRTSIVNKYQNDILEKGSNQYNNLVGLKVITDNAITMTGNVQLITVVSGEPGNVRAEFDYIHCMPYYEPSTHKLYISERQYYACVNKILVPNPTRKEPLKEFRRDKFIARGYKEYEV
jgi:hypothetical protein